LLLKINHYQSVRILSMQLYILKLCYQNQCKIIC